MNKAREFIAGRGLMEFQKKERYDIEDLLSIMALLRAPGGCPWDREQDHHSIRQNFIEETYEVVETIDKGDTAGLREELGDVLLQVVFHARMEEEAGSFAFRDVCDGVCRKLIHRHPHIFGDVSADTTEEVLKNWDEIKKKEKQQTTRTEVLESIPRVLPALIRSEKLQGKAAKSGFCYTEPTEALADLRGEMDELAEAMTTGDRERAGEELGDVLFAASNLARLLGQKPEECLTRASDRFVSRFAAVEAHLQEKALDWDTVGKDQLNRLWQEVKISDE
jgi:tetrapyrrole methylase family protein/MazG family protein